jgi:hypothetical protein
VGLCGQKAGNIEGKEYKKERKSKRRKKGRDVLEVKVERKWLEEVTEGEG